MQSQNKITSALFGNWPLKMISFVVALAIVVAIRFLNATDRTVTIPLTVVLDEESAYGAVSLVPSSIDVVITGDDSIIYLVDPSLIKASVDFSDVSGEGIARRPVSLEYDRDIFNRNGLSVASSPLTVRILFKSKSEQ